MGLPAPQGHPPPPGNPAGPDPSGAPGPGTRLRLRGQQVARTARGVGAGGPLPKPRGAGRRAGTGFPRTAGRLRGDVAGDWDDRGPGGQTVAHPGPGSFALDPVFVGESQDPPRPGDAPPFPVAPAWRSPSLQPGLLCPRSLPPRCSFPRPRAASSAPAAGSRLWTSGEGSVWGRGGASGLGWTAASSAPPPLPRPSRVRAPRGRPWAPRPRRGGEGTVSQTVGFPVSPRSVPVTAFRYFRAGLPRA